MFSNYLKIALRNLYRHKGYSLLNVAGLALGLACAVCMLLWVQDELNFDRFHQQAEHLYRIERDYGDARSIYATSSPLGPAFEEQIPEVVRAARFTRYGTGLTLRFGDRLFYETGYAAVDPTFFDLFSFPFTRGSAEAALATPTSMVLTETLAEKYFGDADPVGRQILVNNEHLLTVTGVVADVPHNSTLQFDLVVPIAFLEVLGWYTPSWASNWLETYVQLQPGAPTDQAAGKALEVVQANGGDPRNALEAIVFKPLRDIHIDAVGYNNIAIFSLLAVFVLLIACINFMNLSTARSAQRAKEIGMRKVVGAHRSNLILQFLGESVLLAVVALAGALVLLAVVLGPFGGFTGKALSLSAVFEARFALVLAGLTLACGLLAGSYPAFVLSAFRPSQVLKGRSRASSGRFRRFLVVFQFGLSVFLIIGTAVIYTQLHYIRGKDLGYDREHLVYIPLTTPDTRAAYETMKTEWLNQPGVRSVTAAEVRPSNIGWNSFADWEGKDTDERSLVFHNRVGYDYTETLALGLAEGRTFSRAFESDRSVDGRGGFLINEETARMIGPGSVVGKTFTLGGTTGPVVGVLKNFHFQSLHAEIKPIALILAPQSATYALLRLQPGDLPEALGTVEATWQRVAQGYPFDYQFLDEDFGQMYAQEAKLGDLLKYFAMIAVLIACLGLFGLASYDTEARRKEIAVRKVMGASSLSVTALLCRQFLILVVLANVLAGPLAGYVMSLWLDDFAYRTEIGWGVFAVAAVGAVGVALLTVSFQTIRAAVANPVASLRHE